MKITVRDSPGFNVKLVLSGFLMDSPSVSSTSTEIVSVELAIFSTVASIEMGNLLSIVI
jgi:hypothetical protein